MNDSISLKKVYVAACLQLEKYVKDGIAEDEINHAKISMAVIGAYARLKASENNSKALTFAVSRAMANDNSELKELVRKQIPEFASN